MLRIAVLISGGGTNLQSIIDATQESLDAQVVGVISNRRNAYGLERAKNHDIEGVYIGKGNYPDFNERSKELIKTLKNMDVDLVVLAGYLEILHESFIKAYEGKILNIHPSLIPKYAGKGYYGEYVHQAVIENKEKYSGATVHFVDEEVDTGQIVLQESVKLSKDETVKSLQEKVLKIEHRILVKSIKKYIDGEI